MTEQSIPASPESETLPEAPVLGWDGKAFDPERAHRALQAAQEDARKARAERDAIKTASERAKLEEVDRLKLEMADLQAKALEAEEKAAELSARRSIEAKAAKLGFNDPEDAYRFVDLSAIDDDPTEALQALLSQKPYLGKQGVSDSKKSDSVQSTPVTTSPGNHAAAKPLTLAQIEKMTPAERAARASDVREFLRTYRR